MENKLIIGILISLAVLAMTWNMATAASALAAEPEITWPAEWTAFGPAPTPATVRARYGLWQTQDLLPDGSLKTIPDELVIGGRNFKGQKVSFENGVLDLGRKLHAATDGNSIVYLFAEIAAPADVTVKVGAGADWWMRWWVDGQPVYDTFANGHAGNGSTPVTGRDHVFNLKLAQGRRVIAVAVVGYRQFLLAVTSPRDLREHPERFQDAMASGKRKYAPPHWSIPISYAAARNDFQQALQLATTDVERAEARLAIADNYLLDIWGMSLTNAPVMRREYSEVLALTNARAWQKARAALGLGETLLLENKCAAAREEFARARNLTTQPGWTSVVHLAMARAYMQEKNNAAARQELDPVAAQVQINFSEGGAPPATYYQRMVNSIMVNPGLSPWMQSTILKFDARLHLAALDVAPRIRPDHPRLFFNADTWPAVKARVQADTNAFRNLQQEVKSLPEEFITRDWGATYFFKAAGGWKSYPDLMTAALVYRVTGDPALLVKIRKMLRATIDHYLRLRDFNAHVQTRVNCLAALDWVWNDLPAAERDALARDLLRYAYGWHVQSMIGGVGRADRDPYYYMPNMYWYVGLVTLNPDLAAVDYLRALTVLGRGYDNNVVASFGMRIERMKDRGMVTRLEYAFLDLPTPSWTFLHCWRSAIGPIPDEWAFASGIAPSCVLRNMLGYGTYRGMPAFRQFGHGWDWRSRGGWDNASLLYDNLGQFMYFFSKSQPEEAAIAAWIRKQMEKAGCSGSGHYLINSYVMDLSGAPAPKLPEGLPLARYYPTNGVVAMSSGFDTNATYALFVSGGGMGETFDTGHFTIFKQGYLALDSGTRAQWASGGGGKNYDFQSVAHNTILIRMPGEVIQSFEANVGGQCRMPTYAKPLAFETSPLFAYAATDATETYHSNKCARMVRQFLYLPPDHFVVFDRVVSKKAEYPKTWLLHTANEPAIQGQEFRADQEQGRIFCRTLLPADAVLEKIGGPGKEFWADGKNWPIPDTSPYLADMGMTNAADVPENVGRWRVEVKPGKTRLADCFLHLIQVGDQTVEKIAENNIKETGDRVVLSFVVGSRTYAITLNKTGDVGGHIRIEENGEAVVDQDLTQKIQPQSGLALTK